MTAPSTADDLAALHARCFTTPRPWKSAEFRDMLSLSGVFLITHDAGFALGRALAGEAELLTLAVAPEQRRQGHGARLLAGFEAGARVRAAETAFLEVAADNTAACALYAGQGYVPAGRRRGYYVRPDGPAIDALVLRKHLTTQHSASA